MPVEPGPPRNPLRLRSLGYPALCDDGGEVRAIERKALGLLVFLGASAAPVSREAAATLLWPEADPEASRARLRRLLHKIAAATGVRAVLADRLSLRLDRAHAPESDARAFEAAADAGALDRAAGLYVGDFLAGFHLPDCPEFEEWALYRREALRGRFIQVLERLIEHASEDFDAEAKLRHANRLVALDPLNETAHRHVIAAHLAAGNAAAAARQLALCARLLHDELGVEPEPATRALLSLPAAPAVASLPRTRYVAVDGVHVAWQTVGDGPVDIVVVPGFVSHLDRMWEDARCRAWLEAAARIGRLILFGRRGVGLSDRGVAEPSIEATARDIGAVMDAAGSRRAVLVGASEGGPGCIHFAADHPDRLRALVLWASLAKGSRSPDYPFALTAEQYDLWLARLVGAWGGAAELATFAPSLVNDRRVGAWWASLLRAASSPGALRGVLAALRDCDVRPLLPQIAVPTTVLHRRGDRAVRFAAGEHLARSIPNARFVPIDGDDHWFWAGDRNQLLSELASVVEAGT